MNHINRPILYCKICNRYHHLQVSYLRDLLNIFIKQQHSTPLSDTVTHITISNTIDTILIRIKFLLDNPTCITDRNECN